MLRILIAEDEAVIAMSLGLMMEELGHAVVGPVATARGALRLLAESVVDMALIDYRLGDGVADALAAALQARRVPFIWMSGFDKDGFDRRDAPLLHKPFRQEDLANAIGALRPVA